MFNFAEWSDILIKYFAALEVYIALEVVLAFLYPERLCGKYRLSEYDFNVITIFELLGGSLFLKCGWVVMFCFLLFLF